MSLVGFKQFVGRLSLGDDLEVRDHGYARPNLHPVDGADEHFGRTPRARKNGRLEVEFLPDFGCGGPRTEDSLRSGPFDDETRIEPIRARHSLELEQRGLVP